MLDALREAALSNLDDVATLRVYADALVERGDPEGERIIIGATDEHPRTPTWKEFEVTGRLGAAIASCTVFRGFLWDVTLRRVTPREFTRLTGRREWSSVRTLHFERGRGWGRGTQVLPPWQCAELVSHPVMSALRQVTGFDLYALQALGARTRAVDIEGVNVLCHHNMDGPDGELAALPKLRRLALTSCHGGHITSLLASSFWRRLRVLELDFENGWVPPGMLAALLEPGTQLEFIKFGPCVGVREPDGWSLTIEGKRLDLADLIVELQHLGQGIGALCLRTDELPEGFRITLQRVARANRWELRLEEHPAGEWQRIEPEPSPGDAPF